MTSENYPRYPTASLKPYREEPLLKGHLWLFSGALQQPPHWIEPGGLADIKSATGKFVARGYYNPHTDIALRVLTRNQEEAIDAEFLRKRIRKAMARRNSLEGTQTNAYRLINAEGDELPGLIVDRYADVLVMQVHTMGMERLQPLLVDVLQQEAEEAGIHGILLRNDIAVRQREGLAVVEPVVIFGEVPPQVTIRENGVLFAVDPWHGQKTGFFLDQRDKRAALRAYAYAKRVLNCFSYTGGFSVYAALTSAATRVTSVDISEPALALAHENFLLNGLDPEQHEFLAADVFDYLQEARAEGKLFDVVIVDPPAFAKSRRAQAQALEAYQRLNLLAMQVLEPGGVLLSCSCTGGVSMDDVRAIITQDAQRLKRPVKWLKTLTHGIDHPIVEAMPETAYLKAVFCRL
jgi:23S rRNA (cytosine1962-C5)-methyltransferase